MKSKTFFSTTVLFAIGLTCCSNAMADNSDAVLSAIKQNIKSNPHLENVDAQFGISGDVVSVSGTAATAEEKALLENVVRTTSGVGKVESNITIVPRAGLTPGSLQVPDDELKTQIANALTKDGYAPGPQLQFAVTNGVASFSGSRASFREIDRILAITMNVPGVKDVKSTMTIGGKSYNSLTFRHEDGTVTKTH